MAAQQYIHLATQYAQQAREAATQFATHASHTIEQLNLPQYAEPLYPFANDLLAKSRPYYEQASQTVTPLYEQATQIVLPHITPYLDLAEPYIAGARPHLADIPQKELMLVVGGLFGGVFAMQLFFAITATCRRRGAPLKAFTPTVFWLLFCTLVHSWLEYAFVFRREGNVSGFQSGMDLYGKADFRYGVGKNLQLEAGTAAMESITALVTGPLCLLLAWGIVGNKSWRWGLQVVVSTCQMYGLAWFASHPFFSVDRVSSEDPFLYWVIFVGLNAPWGIVPPMLLLQALWKINSAISKQQDEQSSIKQAAKKAIKSVAAAASSASKPAASPEKKTKGGK